MHGFTCAAFTLTVALVTLRSTAASVTHRSVELRIVACGDVTGLAAVDVMHDNKT